VNSHHSHIALWFGHNDGVPHVGIIVSSCNVSIQGELDLVWVVFIIVPAVQRCEVNGGTCVLGEDRVVCVSFVFLVGDVCDWLQ
jgi:hypothetical protein